MPDRVVIVNDRSQARGGASGLALLSARLLRERGVPVTFVSGDAAPDPALLAAGVEHLGLGEPPLVERGTLSAFAAGLYNPAALRCLRGWIARNDTPNTVYHLHGWSKILSPAVFHALRPVARRTLLHAHDYFLICPNGGLLNHPRERVCDLRPLSAACIASQCDKRGYAQKLWRVARHAGRRALFDVARSGAQVLLIHPAMEPGFRRAGLDPAQLHTVRNPVDPLCARPVQAWRNRAVVFVGRLEPEKGFEDAAQAARRANVPLEVIGDGPGRALLERRYPEVTIHGWCDRDGIGAHLRRARVAVVPSRVPEPFGLAVVEALLAGVPVALTDAALLAGEVRDLGLGASFRANDVAACARVLERLDADDAAVEAMSRRAAAGGHALANTSQGWIDALMARYRAALLRPAAAAAERPVAA